MNERSKALEKIKQKPNNRFCSCGLEGSKINTCEHNSCQVDREHQKNVNDMVERGWLPIERWIHTD